jgi:complement component 1 Q subcomponent-binding protein
MLSIRSFARAAPRAVSRLSTSSIRHSAARPSTLLQASWKPAQSQFAAAFSTSKSRWQASEDDAQLAKKLESEIEFENSMKEQDGTPASVQEYLDNSPFQLEDIPGQEEVVLTRQYNDERYVRIADIACSLMLTDFTAFVSLFRSQT